MRATSLSAAVLSAATAALLMTVAGCAGESVTGGAGPPTRSAANPAHAVVSTLATSVKSTVAPTPSSAPPSSALAQPPSLAPPPPSTLTTVSEPAPVDVVEAFYAAINDGDYEEAWLLGGDNLGESYSAFASGFFDTVSDRLTVTSTSGSTVYVSLLAEHTDGTTATYRGSYTVHHGQITYATMREISAPPTTSYAGARALCNDGTLSYSRHDSGTCSHHGGVLEWFRH